MSNTLSAQHRLNFSIEPPFVRADLVGNMLYEVMYSRDVQLYQSSGNFSFNGSFVVVDTYDYLPINISETGEPYYLDNLTSYSSYYIHVRIVGTNSSGIIRFRTSPSAPHIPPALLSSSYNGTHIQLQWPVLSNQTGPIVKVQIMVEPFGSKIRFNSSVYAPYDVSAVCTNLVPGLNYANGYDGGICGGMCDVLCPLGTQLSDISLVLTTANASEMHYTEYDANGMLINVTRLLPFITYETNDTATIHGSSSIDRMFTVGDNKQYGRYNNTVLNPVLSYQFRLIVYTADNAYAIGPSIIIVGVSKRKSFVAIYASTIAAFSLALLIIFVVYRYRKWNKAKNILVKLDHFEAFYVSNPFFTSVQEQNFEVPVNNTVVISTTDTEYAVPLANADSDPYFDAGMIITNRISYCIPYYTEEKRTNVSTFNNTVTVSDSKICYSVPLAEDSCDRAAATYADFWTIPMADDGPVETNDTKEYYLCMNVNSADINTNTKESNAVSHHTVGSSSTLEINGCEDGNPVGVKSSVKSIGWILPVPEDSNCDDPMVELKNDTKEKLLHTLDTQFNFQSESVASNNAILMLDKNYTAVSEESFSDHHIICHKYEPMASLYSCSLKNTNVSQELYYATPVPGLSKEATGQELYYATSKQENRLEAQELYSVPAGLDNRVGEMPLELYLVPTRIDGGMGNNNKKENSHILCQSCDDDDILLGFSEAEILSKYNDIPVPGLSKEATGQELYYATPKQENRLEGETPQELYSVPAGLDNRVGEMPLELYLIPTRIDGGMGNNNKKENSHILCQSCDDDDILLGFSEAEILSKYNDIPVPGLSKEATGQELYYATPKQENRLEGETPQELYSVPADLTTGWDKCPLQLYIARIDNGMRETPYLIPARIDDVTSQELYSAPTSLDDGMGNDRKMDFI